MKSKYINFFSATAIGLLSAVAVLGGVASISSAASGGPTVTLTTTSSANTSSTTIPVTATFSEDVNGFSDSDISATNATVSAVSGSGTTFTFNLTPSSEGEVTVMLPADIASSTASSTGSQPSNTLTFTYTPEATTSQPVITNVIVSAVDTDSATITWDTDTLATSQIRYGTTTDYGSLSQVSSTSTMSHSVTLTDLDADTTYHFRVKSTNTAGSNQSFDMTFKTLMIATSTRPDISNLRANEISSNSATIKWNTDGNASAQVFYGTSTSYGSMSTLIANSGTGHSITLNNLAENTTYHYYVTSANTNGTTTSSHKTFTTLTTGSSTPLSVSGIDTVRSNAVAHGTFQNGWEWILHFTIPDMETNFAMKFSDFTTTSSASTIPVANNVRIWTMQSSNASTTASSMMQTNNNYSGNMMLNGDASTTTPGRQIDVHMQVAVPLGTAVGTYTTTFGALSTTTPF